MEADTIIKEFKKINKIPRKSGHEKKISDYLYNRCKDLGFDVIQDDMGNVIAQKGSSNKKDVILQAHMDMVCVKTDDKKIDFLNEGIKCKIEDNKMVAEGTTLGADNGIGVAIILEVMKKVNNVRAVFTTNEEVGMTGAKGLDKKYLDSNYLINCDWEDVNTICNSSAGNTTLEFSKTYECYKAKKENKVMLDIQVKKLPGGHSGVEIHKKIPNAIKVINDILKELKKNNICYNIGNYNGGIAMNAIPSSCSVSIMVNDDDKKRIIDLLKDRKVNGSPIEVGVSSCGTDNVLDDECTRQIVDFVDMCHDGVYTMSESIPDFVESSSNMGTLSLNSLDLKVVCLLRSSDKEKMQEMINIQQDVARKNDIQCIITSSEPSWPIKENSKLLEIACKKYKEKNNKEYIVEPVHAGLECAEFASKNSNLDIISIGPTIIDAHTPSETLFIDTVPIIYELIVEIIKEIQKK